MTYAQVIAGIEQTRTQTGADPANITLTQAEYDSLILDHSGWEMHGAANLKIAGIPVVIGTH